jgi:holo-[acyl-carrier protein] synthase
MSLSVGIDIVENDRIRNLIEKQGSRFLQRHFDPVEIVYCNGKSKPYLHFAGRFAAKEAIYKALKLDPRSWFPWREISIAVDSVGAPIVHLSKAVRMQLSADRVDVSISHCEHYAVAVAQASWADI